MPRTFTFYIPDTEENERLWKNIARIKKASSTDASPIIVQALKDYVEKWMRLNERQTTFNEQFDYPQDDYVENLKRRQKENDITYVRSITYNIQHPKERVLDARDLEWLNSEERKLAISKAKSNPFKRDQD